MFLIGYFCPLGKGFFVKTINFFRIYSLLKVSTTDLSRQSSLLRGGRINQLRPMRKEHLFYKFLTNDSSIFGIIWARWYFMTHKDESYYRYSIDSISNSIESFWIIQRYSIYHTVKVKSLHFLEKCVGIVRRIQHRQCWRQILSPLSKITSSTSLCH